MKSRKTRMLAALGLVAIGGFSLMAISFVEAQTKDIQLNPENARQTIPTIHFRSTINNQAKYVELTNVKNLAGNDTSLVRIDTKVYNFVLRKGNSDASGVGSTILGGNSNNVDGGSYSTIIAGSGNQVNNLSYGTIGGGEGNVIDGNYGTVAGGRSNTAKGYSTVVGGNNNKANGEYAVALGKNTTADGNNSVAMGSGAVVRGANSFLWSDKGATVNANNVFVVEGQRGMVVNTSTAHRFAQMTIGGSLLINDAATNKQVECRGGTKGKGVVKVINRTGDNSAQVCFCSCDGDKRHSLFGAGNCSSVCGGTDAPACSTAADNLIKRCDETKSTPQFVYSGKCAVGDVVDGPGAYFVDSSGYVHWTCQTNDGAHKDCSSMVKFTETGACSEPAAEPECNGSYVGSCYEFLEGSDRGFNGRVDATLYANRSAALGHSCAYYCVNGCYKDGDQCKERQDCTQDMINDYELPYLAHGASTGVSKVVAGQTCTTTASCNDGRRTLGVDNCTQNTCTGGQPGNNTIKSTATPSSSRGWTYKAGSSLSQLGACEWACTDDTYQRDGTTMNCKKIPKCTGSQPGNNTIKSSATPSSDKGWTYKTGYSLSQLGACEWSCLNSDYERIGNNMYCTEKSNQPCNATTISGYDVSAMQDGDIKSVTEKKEDGDCELSCSAAFLCSNGDVTKLSESCSCNAGCELVGNTLNDANCSHQVINDPIVINVSCNIAGERRSSQNRCDGPAWKGTTFTVDNIVPVQLNITENLKYHNVVDSSCNYLVNETRTNEWVVNAGSDTVVAKPWTHTWGWRDVTAFDHQEGYQAYYEVGNDYTLEIPSRGITVQYGRAEEIVVDGQTYKIEKKPCSVELDDNQPPESPECGSATRMPSLEKPAANTLCSGGTATDPAEAIVGEPGSLGWSWKCGDLDCWTYIPTSRVDCESISTSPSAPAVFLADNYIASGAWVQLHIGVWCNNGEREDIRDSFKYDPSNWLGILLLNGAYCAGKDGIRSVERVDVVGFSDRNYNGHRLIPGSSCTNDNSPECGTANGTMRDDAPAAYDELCKVGSPTVPYGDGMGDDGWGWQCEKEGKTTAYCTARKTPKCGNASGDVLPEFPSDDQACDPGYVFVDDNGQTSGKFEWRCGNGTGQVYCSADAKANVKFVVNYNGGGTIYVKEVDIGERGQSDRTSEYGCVPEGGGEAQLGQGGIIGNSVTINCSGKDFMVGKTYYPDLVYGTVQGTRASGHPYGGYSITPSVGENVYTFTVDGYNCVGNPPGVNTIYPSTVPTSSNKPWTYKTGYSLSQLGACEWSCVNSDYERKEDNMYCTEKSNQPCNAEVIDGYTVPAMQHGKIETVTRTKASGGCTLSCSATFSCRNKEVTKTSESCDCGNNCGITPVNGATFNNATCVQENTISCCEAIPEHGVPLGKEEGMLEEASLCTPLVVADDGGYELGEPEGDCWYQGPTGQHTNGCGWGKYCCFNGPEQISCGPMQENHCGSSGEPSNGVKYDRFGCEGGYRLEGCDCVLKSEPECGSAHNTVRTTQPSGSMLCSGDSVASPVLPTDSGWEWSCTLESGGYEMAAECSARKLQNITIKCDTDYYDGSEFVGGWVGGCSQIMWKSTTYTATSPVPTDIYIEQEKHQYGISSRDSNSCQFCFHPASTAVTPYIIRANQRMSTIHGGGWISTISRRGLSEGGIGFDSYLMNGNSSISFNGVGNDYPGNISTVNHYLEYTGSNGVEYHITLVDCDNVYENWINSTSTEYIKPTGQTCSRGSNPSDPNPGGGGGGGGGGGSSQLITLNNTTQRYIRLTNNTEYPFHFTDTSAYETDCIGSTEACDLYLQPGQQDFAITYDYCNVNTSFYAQSCRFGPDDGCGTLYQIPISCSTSIIDLDQLSASTR